MRSFVDVDRHHDVAYILLRPELRDRAAVVARSIRVAEDVVLDLDAEDQLIGIELLRASSRLDVDRLTVGPSELIVGDKEAAEMLGMERSDFIRDYADKPDFPPPIAELGSDCFWLRPAIQRYMLLRDQAGHLGALLTAREIEIVCAIAKGLHNKAIADRLNIGEFTVQKHLHNIYQKLKLEGRHALTVYAHEHGLV